MKFQKLHENAQLPTRHTVDAAGYDLHTIEAGCVGALNVFHTGVGVTIPKRHVGLIRDRSGLAAKHGITVLAGVIDADYIGEIKVILSCVQDNKPHLGAGDRIAQLVVVPCVMEDSEWCDAIESVRGDNGFGSSGK